MIKKSPLHLVRLCSLPLGIALFLFLVLLVALVQSQTVAARPGAQETSSSCIRNVTNGAEGVHRQPVINSQCNRVAFWSTGNMSSSPDRKNVDGSIEIFVAELGEMGITLTQITSSTGSILGGFNLAPSISGDGRRVAFFSDRDLDDDKDNLDGNFEIFVAKVSNGDIDIIQVTDTPQGVNIAPSISENGYYIAFASDMNLDPDTGNTDGNFEVFVARVDDDYQVTILQVTKTSNEVINDQPRINQAGDRIVFVSTGKNLGNGGNNSDGNFEVFMAEMDIQAAEPVVDGIVQVTHTGGGAINDQPTIGTDQDGVIRIAFLSEGELDPYPDNGDGNLELFIAQIDQVGAIAFTQATHTTETHTTETVNDYPEISTDGSFVAFVSDGDLDPLGGNNDGNLEQFLYEISQDKLFQVSDTPIGTKNSRLSISKDGECMAFEAGRDIQMTECLFVDVSMQKTEFQDPSWAGDLVTYTLTITNHGPSRAMGLVITDELPVDILYSVPVTISNDGVKCGDLESGYITCTLGSLPSGEQATVDIAFETEDTLIGKGNNVARVSNDVPEREPKNNEMSITTTFKMRSDVGISIRHPGDPLVGQDTQITYTLDVVNHGPSLAYSVWLTEQLPTNFDFPSGSVEISPTGVCEYLAASAVVSCALGDMSPKDTWRGDIVIPVNLTRTIPFSSTAWVTYSVRPADSIMPDPNLVNNRYTSDSQAAVKADLSISVNSEPANAVPGETITYTIRVANAGPSVAVGAIVSDDISDWIQNPTWQCDDSYSDSQCGTDDPQLGAIDDTATLEPYSEALIYTAWGVLQPDVEAPVLNTAQVLAPGGVIDDNLFDNEDTDSNSPQPAADLFISKSNDPVIMGGFDTVTYTLFVDNQGPSDARQVYITDVLPISVTLQGPVVVSPAGLFNVDNTDPLLLSTPTLPANVSGTITFRAYVDTDKGVVFNTAVISSATTERHVADNESEAQLSLTPVVDWLYSSYSVDENDPNNALITVTLSASISETVWVSYTTQDGTAVAPDDYTAIPTTTLIFAPGLTEKVFEVTLQGDPRYEHDETVTLILFDAKNAMIVGNGEVTLTISNDDPIPEVYFDASAYNVDEDVVSGSATIGVIINAESGLTVTVDYTVTNGTAEAPNDFEADTGTLTIPPGLPLDTSFDVTITNDLYDEDDETVSLTLGHPENAVLGSPNSVMLTIQDEDPTPELNIDNVEVPEGNTGSVPAIFTVSLNGLSSFPISVDFTTVDGTASNQSDYATITGTLHFAPEGELPKTKTITVTVNGDWVDEDDSETFNVSLSNPSHATIGATNPGVGTINDDDYAGVNVNPGEINVHEEGPMSANYTVRLNSQPTDTVNVTLDYSTTQLKVEPSLPLSFGPFTWSNPKTVIVTAVDDKLVEYDHDSVITHTAGVYYSTEVYVTAHIADNDYTDLALSKTVNNAAPKVGDTIRYTVMVSNLGPYSATGVLVSDTLPVGVSYQSHNVAYGDYYSTTGLWELGALDDDQTASLSIRAQVTANYGQAIINTAELLDLLQEDTNVTNDEASVVITVTNADLEVLKTVNVVTPTEGDLITYTVTVTNLGPCDATGVVISDQLPIPAVSYIISSATQGNYDNGEWNVDSLDADATAVLTITAQVGGDKGGAIIVNTATVSVSDQYDDDKDNNHDSAVIGVGAFYRDEFTDTAVYSGSNGTRDWIPDPWVEVGDEGTSITGTILVTVTNESFDSSYTLGFIGSSNIEKGKAITRSVDLSAASAARLSFNYGRVHLGEYDAVDALISYDGGSTWITLTQFYGTSSEPTDSSWQFASYSLRSKELGEDTVVKFEVVKEPESADNFYIDNVNVAFWGGKTYRDEFNAQACDNNDGTDNWSGSWITSATSITVVNDPSSGSGYSLGFMGGSGARSVFRTADLTGTSAAILSFNYYRDLGSGEVVVVQVSYDGGSSWEDPPLGTFTFVTSSDSTWQFASYALDSERLSNQTSVRFRSDDNLSGSAFYVDNVEIWCLPADGGASLLSAPPIAAGPVPQLSAASPGPQRMRLSVAERSIWGRRRLLSGRPGGVPR